MRVTIICEDKDIEVVRDKASSFITSHVVMARPLSPNGKFPQTHWFCICDLTNSVYNNLLADAKYCKIFTGSPKTILNELGLMSIR